MNFWAPIFTYTLFNSYRRLASDDGHSNDDNMNYTRRRQQRDRLNSDSSSPLLGRLSSGFDLSEDERSSVLEDISRLLSRARSILDRGLQRPDRDREARYEECLSLVDRALSTASDPDACDPSVAPLATCHLYRGHTLVMLCRYADAWDAYDAAVRAWDLRGSAGTVGDLPFAGILARQAMTAELAEMADEENEEDDEDEEDDEATYIGSFYSSSPSSSTPSSSLATTLAQQHGKAGDRSSPKAPSLCSGSGSGSGGGSGGDDQQHPWRMDVDRRRMSDNRLTRAFRRLNHRPLGARVSLRPGPAKKRPDIVTEQEQ